MIPADEGVALAERVLAILDEGAFSATYKFALFVAILVLCIEKTARDGAAPTSLTTRDLAAKVTGLYWDHALPYEGHGTLRQGGVRPGNQAEILRAIQEHRAAWADDRTDTFYAARARHPEGFAQLVDLVEWKLIKMPIPRLQVLGRREERFLYEYHWTQAIPYVAVRSYQRRKTSEFDNRLLLLPGVAEKLIRLNGLLRPLFHREWAAKVACLNGLSEAGLERFLFGVDRASLNAVRGPLTKLQNDLCFYCKSELQGRAEVDHFIPWSRYPDDGLDNLVVAHRRCNNSKRDFLGLSKSASARAVSGSQRGPGVHTHQERRRASGPAHSSRRGVGMTTRYPIVFESERTGAVSAYVPDLPLYAAANTAEEAEREIRELLSFTAPWALFLEMESDVEGSFLELGDWRELRARQTGG
jgi:hypothetical protein